ncbi:MAG: TIR domain-containing protein [Planctomycetota bacterium]
MIYSAFISYSHGADGKFAPTLQSALQRFAKPWYRMRALRIFRDSTDLSVSPELWPDITRALDESEFLVFLASPEAARSKWVKKELTYWRENKDASKLLVVLTSGEIVWDDAVGDFDWQRTTAVPDVLRGAFQQEPLYVDSRRMQSGQLSLSNGDFLDHIATIAARLHGRSKDGMIGEHIHQHRRTMRLAWSAIATLVSLTLLAGWQWRRAEFERTVAQQKQALAELQSGQIADRQDNVDDALLWFGRSYATAADPAWKATMGNVIAGCAARLGQRLVGGNAAFSADGRFLLLQTQPDAMQLYDSRTGNLAGPIFKVGEKSIAATAISPDMTRVLSTSDDCTAQLFDAASGNLIREIPDVETKLPRDVGTTGFSPDGRFLLFLTHADERRTLKICDARTGVMLDQLSHDQSIGTIATTAAAVETSRVLTGGKDGKAMLWDAASRITRELPHEDQVWSVQFSHDGKLAATGSGSRDPPERGIAQVWDATNGERRWQTSPQAELVSRVWFDPTDSHLITMNGVVAQLWDARTGRRYGVSEDAGTGDFSADGEYSLNVRDQCSVEIRSALDKWKGDNRPFNRLPHAYPVEFQEFIPESDLVVTKTSVGRLWQLTRGKGTGILRRVFVEQSDGVVRYRSAILSDNGASLVTAGYSGEQPVLWNTRGGFLRAELKHADPVGAAAFSHDGRFVVTGTAPLNGSGILQIWDTATGSRRGNPMPDSVGFQSVAFSRDGRSILAGGNKGTAQIWDVQSSKPRLTVPIVHGDLAMYGLPAMVGTVAFSPDASLALTAASSARLWSTVRDVASAEEDLNPFRRSRVVLSSDGSLLLAYTLSDTSEASVQVWDFQTLKAVTETIRIPNAGDILAVSLDGGRSVVKQGSSARIRDLKKGAWIGEPLEHEQKLGEEEKSGEQVRSAAFSPDGRLVITGTWLGKAQFWDGATGFPCGALIHDKPVDDVAFSPDGTLALTRSYNDKIVRIWDVSAPPIDDAKHPARLQRSLELRTRRRLGANGEIRVLSDEDLQRLRNELHEMGGPCDSPTWGEYNAWKARHPSR